MTVRGQAHSLSAWFVLALRLMMGYAFLAAGWSKLTAAQPFDAAGYLTNAVPTASPMLGVFHWMGTTPWSVDFVNVAVPWGELFIGLALIVGAFVRLAAFFGGGHILGLDARIERYEVGGEPLAEKYPALQYILG